MVTAEAGDGMVLLSWLPPSDTGGQPVTDYNITGVPGASLTVPGSTTVATVGGLTNGLTYSFTVSAVTAAGSGAPSEPSNGVAPNSNGSATGWTETSGMVTPRGNHLATLLRDGRVLVVGGQTATSNATNSAELYDPGSGNFSPTGSAGTGHGTATLLPDGRVLAVGGFDGSGPTPTVFASAELYDPDSGVWAPTGSMNVPRYSHTATLLADGRVLVAGGQTSATPNAWTATAEIYDPATGTWTPTGSMQSPRAWHTATLLPNGKVLVAGGGDPSTAVTAELYDPRTGTWSSTGTLNTWFTRASATLLPTGKVLLVGSDTCGYQGQAELYDPATGTWSTAASMVDVHANSTATLRPDGKVLVVGGTTGTCAGQGAWLATAELFDPASLSWTTTGTLHDPRVGHTETGLINGQVLIAGGYTGTAEAFALATTSELYAAPQTLLGDQRIQPHVDTNPSGTAEAFRYTAASAGTVRELAVYVDPASNATSVLIGLYVSTPGGNPGALLTTGTISNPLPGAWNRATVAPAQVRAGTQYWLAVLAPRRSGTLVFRDRYDGTGDPTQTSAQTALTLATGLPKQWKTGTRYANSPASVYAAP